MNEVFDLFLAGSIDWQKICRMSSKVRTMMVAHEPNSCRRVSIVFRSLRLLI